jgi:hypothetical protein
MKRRTWFALMATGLVLVAAVAYVLEIRHFGPGGGDGGHTLVIREGAISGYSAVKIEPSQVEAELPRLYRLLEKAYHEGVSHTSDAQLIRQIWKYLEEATGSIERNVNIEYRSKVFHPEQAIQ